MAQMIGTRADQVPTNGMLGPLAYVRGPQAPAMLDALRAPVVVTAAATAEAGKIYACDTTAAAFTLTLPAAPRPGMRVSALDYAGTFGTKPLTLGRNGSKIAGAAADMVLNTNGAGATLVYVDAVHGWGVVK